MRVGEKQYRTVWMEESSVYLIDQNQLPFHFAIHEAKAYKDTCHAIKTMIVRGAGAIGAAAGYAMAQAFLEHADIEQAKKNIEATRPTAQNLFYATTRVFSAQDPVKEAQSIADEDAAACKRIGEYGQILFHKHTRVLTHCNAGWLAFVDYGTALSPIYEAQRKGKRVFVWVDETRPRGQGARLTAWELYHEQVTHMIIPDNAAASLIAQGKVDLVLVGADRIAQNGDVANKIGTLEKAICAKAYGIPFYVAAPTATIDFSCASGKDIPIEERTQNEVLYQTGKTQQGTLETILVASPHSGAYNPAFDVTPAKYITGIITERGVLRAKEIITLKSK